MGNMCRSPMAQRVATKLAQDAGLARQLQFDSAGTHSQYVREHPDPRATAVLLARHYPVAKSRPRQLIEKDFRRYDWILAMDRNNLRELKRLCPPEYAHKVRLFLEGATGIDVDEVPDPYYGNLAGFERVLDLCEAGVRDLIQTLR